MLKTAERRQRSWSVFGRERCFHPGMRPVSAAEAEQLLRNVQPLLEEDEEDLEDVFIKPKLPKCSSSEHEQKCKKLAHLTAKFHLSQDHLLHIEKRMLNEVNRGLGAETNASANIKSYITYICSLPTGKEAGQFLALDLGGTNFRVILVQLVSGSRSVRMKSCKHQVSEELMLGTGEALFDFMADCLYNFLSEHELLNSRARLRLGFTFSFPTFQKELAIAELTAWTKGYKCSDVEGKDVGALLSAAIKKRPQLNVQVDAILNDTTGCLMACAYKRPECAIGVIMGTGTNASYVENMSNVELYDGSEKEKGGYVVINTEWGAFGNTGSLDIIRTSFDHQLDAESINPGKQVYEKLVSGMYLGELARLVIVDATEMGILFGGTLPASLEKKGSFPTKYISAIEADESRTWFEEIDDVLVELDIENATEFDKMALRYICECVSNRAASLAGAGVASLVNKIGRRRITIGMDGSLYKFHPHFGRRMKAVVRSLVCDCIEFDVVLSEDGSGRGAALAVAASATITSQ